MGVSLRSISSLAVIVVPVTLIVSIITYVELLWSYYSDSLELLSLLNCFPQHYHGSLYKGLH